MTALLKSICNDATRNTGRANQGVVVMENAMRAVGPNSRPGPMVGANKFSELQIREEWNALVLPFSRGQLSKAGGLTPDGAKKWLDGSRAPNLAKALNAARALPIVQAWLIERAGGGDRAAQSGSADAVLQIVRQTALGEGPAAVTCRAILRQVEQPIDDRRDNVVRDLFAGRH